MFNTQPMDFHEIDADGFAVFREAPAVQAQRNGDETILYTDDGDDVSTILKFKIDE